MKPNYPIGEYTPYTTCRSCLKPTTSVINLGEMPLAGGFIKNVNDIQNEKYYPLELTFCTYCFLLQTNTVVNADTLFKNYFYHSSAIKTLVNHFEEVVRTLPHPKGKTPFLLEIGCNDGSFIQSASQNGFKAVGIDPATNIVEPLIKKGLPIINDYFSSQSAQNIKKKYGAADIIFSSNTLAHIENIRDVFQGIKLLLKNDGILVFEVHYLGNLIKELQYDMIYHEHQYYYSLLSLQNLINQFNLEAFDVKLIPIHAGSIRFYIQHAKGPHTIQKSVTNLIKKEESQKLNKKATYHLFSKQIEKTRTNLVKKLRELKKSGKTIAGYGASGRGTVISNYCSLGNTLLNYIIDDAPAKQGTFMPGTHLEIISSKILSSKKRPDYVVLFAWSFFKEIQKRNRDYINNGGKFIIPLPKVQIL